MPDRCRKNIRTLMTWLMVDKDTADAMLKLTAVMMDLSPDDPRVVEMILRDTGDYVA